jgi:hypothetical protein
LQVRDTAVAHQSSGVNSNARMKIVKAATNSQANSVNVMHRGLPPRCMT